MSEFTGMVFCIVFIVLLYGEAHKPRYISSGEACRPGEIYLHEELGEIQITKVIYKVNTDKIKITSLKTGGDFVGNRSQLTATRAIEEG